MLSASYTTSRQALFGLGRKVLGLWGRVNPPRRPLIDAWAREASSGDRGAASRRAPASLRSVLVPGVGGGGGNSGGGRARGGRAAGGASASAAAASAAAAAPTAAAASQTFAELGLSDGLLAGLAAAGIAEPTEIQRMAVPAVLAGGDCLLASHTGSGKTLAYLLPVVEQLKRAEADGAPRRARRPRVLVLGPTKELVDQIKSVAKSLSHAAKFSSTALTSASGPAVQRSALAGPIDVVFATPTRLLQHNEEGSVHFGDVAWVVVDEADTMVVKGFEPEVRRIIGAVKGKPEPAQVVLVSATVPPAIERLMSQMLPGIKPVRTSTLHRAIAGSRHQFVTVPPGGDKLAMALQFAQGDAMRGRHALVFAGTVASARALDHYCREHGLNAVCYHGEMTPDQRRESMQAFAGHNPDSPDAAPVMICTDLAARGLDFTARVDHVINFDFPRTPVDYLHRTGRTARAGATGKVTSLVGKHDHVLADRIQWALQHNEPLDGIDKDAAPMALRNRGSGSGARAARGGDSSDRGARGGRGGGRGGRGGGGGRSSSRDGRRGSARSPSAPPRGRGEAAGGRGGFGGGRSSSSSGGGGRGSGGRGGGGRGGGRGGGGGGGRGRGGSRR